MIKLGNKKSKEDHQVMYILLYTFWLEILTGMSKRWQNSVHVVAECPLEGILSVGSCRILTFSPEYNLGQSSVTKINEWVPDFLMNSTVNVKINGIIDTLHKVSSNKEWCKSFRFGSVNMAKFVP